MAITRLTRSRASVGVGAAAGPAVLLTLTIAAGVITSTQARVNATSAWDVFMIVACASCTTDRNSIFCTQAASDSNFVNNGTKRTTIAEKKALFGAAEGARFCWEGTFGGLLRSSGNFSDILGSSNAACDLGCDTQNLFYRQCVIPQQMAIILMSVGCIVFVAATTCILFYCGCCKCLNKKGDESRWGMCNRFCPWMPCSDPPPPEDKAPEWQTNPVTDEEQNKSLFGKSSALKAVEVKPRSLTDLKKPGTAV